jgi:hypothetical protein
MTEFTFDEEGKEGRRSRPSFPLLIAGTGVMPNLFRHQSASIVFAGWKKAMLPLGRGNFKKYYLLHLLRLRGQFKYCIVI